MSLAMTNANAELADATQKPAITHTRQLACRPDIDRQETEDSQAFMSAESEAVRQMVSTGLALFASPAPSEQRFTSRMSPYARCAPTGPTPVEDERRDPGRKYA
jgi:hypothetical protein